MEDIKLDIEELKKDSYVNSFFEEYEDPIITEEVTDEGYKEVVFESTDCNIELDISQRTLFLCTLAVIQDKISNKELAKRSLARKLEEGKGLCEALGSILLSEMVMELVASGEVKRPPTGEEND